MAVTAVLKKIEALPSKYDFNQLIRYRELDLKPLGIDTLQVNITKLCNQACRHCHVDASPARKEMLSRAGIERCLKILHDHPQIKSLDITGGAPELHPDFDWFVTEAVKLGRHVIVRHNLTVAYDGHPHSGESKEYLHDFFAAQRCEVVSSLPYYQEYFTDAQRGSGVFQKSIRGLLKLNSLGYGIKSSGLKLNLVYNPVGPYLPAAQEVLEADYKRELKSKFGIVFNQLYTITNMPINRFKLHLEKSGQFDAYMEKLLAAFNPVAAAGVMCRNLINVSWEGKLYDCDFNQMMEIEAEGKSGNAPSIFAFDFEQLMARRIRFDDHCLGCTAGAGSSCGGVTV
jgi:radical SAM/Cys-rich protein